MSLLYNYATGSIIESTRYNNIDDLLSRIPNNTQNLVDARDVRDSVYSLWELISDVSDIATINASVSSTFSNTDPTTIEVGGIPEGSTFPGSYNLQQMFDLLLYPYVSPSPLLTTNLYNKEYGQSTNFGLSWSVVKKSNMIIDIKVNNITQPISGGGLTNQSGTQIVVGTHSNSNVPISTPNTFTMSVTDDSINTVYTNTTINWMNNIYWGSIDLSSLSTPNPDLTLDPSLISLVSNYINSSMIVGLTGSGVGSGKELTTSKSKNLDGINGNGNYLIFAWASNIPDSKTPKFITNGMLNTAFSRAKTDWNFTNINGFVNKFEVWVSNTRYFSPINLNII